MSMFDLEKHFAFYGAYHRNPVNVVIHMMFVWPIFFSSLMMFYYIPIPKFGLLYASVYALNYLFMDKKAGSLAALMCFLCWVGATTLASNLGYSLTWKHYSRSSRGWRVERFIL